MNPPRVHQQLLALALPVTCMLSAAASAQSTWLGTTTQWSTATNWDPGIPAPGADITINNTTTSGLTLNDGSKTVGSITFGNADPLRINGFTFVTTTTNNLTINNGGITADGNFTANNGQVMRLRGHTVVAEDQIWSVGGSANHANDQGIFVANLEPNEAANRGSLTLSGNLTKEGPGQIMFGGVDVFGPGNIIVNAGDLKYNAGSSLPLVVSGVGNVTLNNASTLAIYKNSGTLNISRAIVMNGTSSLIARNNTVDIASPVTFTGTHTLDAGGTTNLTGALTGTGTVNRSGGSGTLTLSGNHTGFTGTFNQVNGTTNLTGGTFGGDIGVSGGTLTASGAIAKNATVTAGTANLNGGLTGNAIVSGGTANLNGGVTGNVSATGGTTNLGGPVSGSVTLGAGATLSGEVAVAGGISLNGGTLSTNGITPGSLNTPGNLVIAPGTTVNLTPGPPDLSAVTILSYGGTLTGGVANLALANPSHYRSPVFSDSTPGVITFAAASENRTWTGPDPEDETPPVWDINTSPNWAEGDQKFLQLDAVTFDDTGVDDTGIADITLAGVLNPTSITVDSQFDYTFIASVGNLIAGGGPLSKSGAGTLTLGGANTFTGDITVSEGVLKAASNQAFGLGPKTITVASGAAVDAGGVMNANRDYDVVLEGAGPDGASISGAIINSGGGANNGFRSLTLTGDTVIGGTGRWDVRPIAGNNSFDSSVKLGGHTLTKTGPNTIAVVDGVIDEPGDINIDQGILSFTRDTVSGEGSVNINNGATMWLENYSTGSFNKPIAINGSTLRLQGGSFTLGSAVTLTDVPVPEEEITGEAKISVGGGIALTVPNAIAGDGGLEKLDTGALVLTADNTYAGPTRISGGVIQLGNGGTTGSINAEPIELAATNAGIRFNRSDDFTFTNVITGSGITGNALNPAAVNKDGPNTLTLVAANTYTGTTRHGGGFIDIGSNESVFGDPDALIDLRTAGNGGIRSSDASPRSIPNPISYSESTILGSPGTGKLTFTGAVSAGGGSKSFIVNNDETEFSGVIAGTGAGTALTKEGPGTLILSGDNTYTQNTIVSQGVLQLGNGGPAGSLNPSTTITTNTSLVIHRSLPEEVTEISILNLISGTGSVTHSGPAYTILGADNTYTGDTIVTDGTLSPTHPYFADTSAIRISGNGKLDLFHGQTDTVGSFYLDGVAQSPGLWGRSGAIAQLGADFETASITGDGLLEVTSSGNPFSQWAAGSGLIPGVNDGPADNPDQDGLDNFGEFAFDGDPLSGATGGKIVVKVATVGGQPALTLTLPVRAAVGAFSGANALTATGDGVTYTIEGSNNLEAWLLDIDEVTGDEATAIQAGLPGLSSTDWRYRTFRSPGPVTGDPAEFLRARAE